MDNQEKDIASFEPDKDNNTDEYKYLVQKLKSISERIDSLEKIYLHKET